MCIVPYQRKQIQLISPVYLEIDRQGETPSDKKTECSLKYHSYISFKGIAYTFGFSGAVLIKCRCFYTIKLTSEYLVSKKSFMSEISPGRERVCPRTGRKRLRIHNLKCVTAIQRVSDSNCVESKYSFST